MKAHIDCHSKNDDTKKIYAFLWTFRERVLKQKAERCSMTFIYSERKSVAMIGTGDFIAPLLLPTRIVQNAFCVQQQRNSAHLLHS